MPINLYTVNYNLDAISCLPEIFFKKQKSKQQGNSYEPPIIPHCNNSSVLHSLCSIAFGWMSDLKQMNRLGLVAGGVTLSGLCCMFVVYLKSFADHCIFVSILGITQCTYE